MNYLFLLTQVIFYEKLILAGMIVGIFIFAGINIALFLLWLGIIKNVKNS